MKRYFLDAKGFTLLEIMIVLGMLGLLTTLSLPSYQRYLQRAKFIEVAQAVVPYKIGVTLCPFQQGELIGCNTPCQNNIPGNFQNNNPNIGYASSIKVGEKGVVTAISQGISLDKRKTFTYTLKPTLKSTGIIKWTS